MNEMLNCAIKFQMEEERIYTVSELTRDIKDLMEINFPFVWVSGEISDFHRAGSGHSYFTLKDRNARISAVMFRGQGQNLRFLPENGMEITGIGRINVYEPRGRYQIIFEYLEPAGAGALHAAFEQLRKRLSDEGLFDDRYKKPIPFYPKKISVITSRTGAVIRDIMNVISRRFPNILIEIIPVSVQGEGSASEIADAIRMMNTRGDSDVAILARGGGSLEDLQAFNSETVARAVFLSEIPIISAVGHETDFTIADFVADVRAPTPSAAAELAVPVKNDLKRELARLRRRLKRQFRKYVEYRRVSLNGLSERLTDPKKQITDLRLKTDDLTGRLVRVFTNRMTQKREHLLWRTERLRALGPLSVLSRGYSITRTLPDETLVRDSETVSNGQKLEIILATGSLICRVEGKKA